MAQDSSHASFDFLASEEIDALWKIANPVEGQIKLENAITLYPSSADELRTQIARSLGLQGRFDEAWEELSKIDSRHSAVVEIRTQIESGRLKNSSGDQNQARPYFLKALELAQQEHLDYYAIDAAHMLGILSEGQESVQWNTLALQIAATSKIERAQNWKGSLLNNLGWTYFNMGEFNTALPTFESALDFQKAAGDPVRVRIARWTVARCLRALGKYDEALAIQTDLIQYPEEGYVSEELGELFLLLGRPEAAKPRFKKAYELLSQKLALDPSQRSRLTRLRELSDNRVCP